MLVIFLILPRGFIYNVGNFSIFFQRGPIIMFYRVTMSALQKYIGCNGFHELFGLIFSKCYQHVRMCRLKKMLQL